MHNNEVDTSNLSNNGVDVSSLSKPLRILYNLLNDTYDTLHSDDVEDESEEAEAIRKAFHILLKPFRGVVLIRSGRKIQEISNEQQFE